MARLGFEVNGPFGKLSVGQNAGNPAGNDRSENSMKRPNAPHIGADASTVISCHTSAVGEAVLRLLFKKLPARERDQMIERICDYFAGCLLMPRAWVQAGFANGTRHPMDLAQVFGVSPTAMGVRLNQIGLTRPGPRCGAPRHGWTHTPWPAQRAGPKQLVGVN